MSNTQPQVNLDEVLEALDGDTQAYLRALFIGGGQGLKGRARDLGKVLGGLGPINQKLARLNRLVAQRKDNLSSLIHNLNILTGTIADNGDQLAQLVDSSNAALGAIASQDLNVQRAVALLPGDPADRPHDAGQGRGAGRACSARPSTTCGPSPATSTTHERVGQPRLRHRRR